MSTGQSKDIFVKQLLHANRNIFSYTNKSKIIEFSLIVTDNMDILMKQFILGKLIMK
jgi:hypothetical protein